MDLDSVPSITDPITSTKDIKGLSEKYELVSNKQINNGHFGRVYEARELSTGLVYAIKIIAKAPLSDQQRRSVFSEVGIMRQLNHKNIIALKELLDLDTHFVIVMELMRGGDLFDYLKKNKITEENARSIVIQLASAIEYIHKRNIAHRDIKIENLMFVNVDSMLIKIGDFGLAKQLGALKSTSTPCGTIDYMAPEMQRKDKISYGKSVDVWALGCLMYIILFGHFPFHGDYIMSREEKIKDGLFSFPTNSSVSKSARDIISQCLQVDSHKRFDINQCIMHPWIRTEQTMSPALEFNTVFASSSGANPIKQDYNLSLQYQRDDCFEMSTENLSSAVTLPEMDAMPPALTVPSFVHSLFAPLMTSRNEAMPEVGMGTMANISLSAPIIQERTSERPSLMPFVIMPNILISNNGETTQPPPKSRSTLPSLTLPPATVGGGAWLTNIPLN